MKKLGIVLTTILAISPIVADNTKPKNLESSSHLSKEVSNILDKTKISRITSFKSSCNKAFSQSKKSSLSKRGIKSFDKHNSSIRMKSNNKEKMFLEHKASYDQLGWALLNPDSIKVIDDRGNLISLTLELDNSFIIEANATYNEDDLFIYGKYTQGDHWMEESVLYEDTTITSTIKSSEGMIIVTESPIAFAETSIEKFNSNGLPILISESVGDEVVFQLEMKYDDQNRTVYEKTIFENSFNEVITSYDEDGTVHQNFSGTCSFKLDDSIQEEISFQKEEYEDGKTVVRYIGEDTGKIYFEEIFTEDSQSYHKYTDDTGYWVETKTVMDSESGTMKIVTLDSNGVKITQTVPLENRYNDNDRRYSEELYEYTDDFYEDNYEIGDERGDSSANSSIPPVVPSTSYDITPEFISNLPTGWNLIGASKNVDIDLLKGMKSIFKYDAYNQAWEYVQFDENGKTIREEGNLKLNAFDGFWINK